MRSGAFVLAMAVTIGAPRFALAGPSTEVPDVASDGACSKYGFPQSRVVEVGSGATHVTAEVHGAIPRSGYYPLRVLVDNEHGPGEKVALTFANRITKTIDVAAGERRSTWMLVPVSVRDGRLEARAPGITSKEDGDVYLGSADSESGIVLSLGTNDDFEKAVGCAPSSTNGSGLQVIAIPPTEAPIELAAYAGFDAVAIPSVHLDALSEGARRAIEAYAATGGAVIAPRAGRAMNLFFPLENIEEGRIMPYGLGRVLLSSNRDNIDLGQLVRQVRGTEPGIHPVEYAPHARRYRSYRPEDSLADVEPLLPVTAPTGLFLTIISLFSLLIGPGSVWVARKRGPAALLVTIPATAFLACAVMLGSSLLRDGFTIHASSQGYTELDSIRHRAFSSGVVAYYANLSPSAARFDILTALVNSDREDNEPVAVDWGDTQTVTAGFLLSRTYREWGVRSVTPTRARVVAKPGPDGVRVQNALGAKVRRLSVSTAGGIFEAYDVAEGAEVAARPVATFTPPSRPEKVTRRLGAGIADRVRLGLEPGKFVAEVEGQGFLPNGGLDLEHHDSLHVVCGRFE